MSFKRKSYLFRIFLYVGFNIQCIVRSSINPLHGSVQSHRYKNPSSTQKHLRQRDQPFRFTKKDQDENHQEKKSKVTGPPRNIYYNPSYGYEPYWQGGDWVFENYKENGTHIFCEDRCSPIYKKFGVICGRNKHLEHRTFKNYCEMNLHNCHTLDGWYIAYRGQCKTLEIYTGTDMPSRADYHIENFYTRNPKLS